MTALNRIDGEYTFYSTTLYGLVPDVSPNLDDATYKDLSKLLNQLISNGSGSCLRAAHGIIRSFFSISVLAKMADSESRAPNKISLVERHIEHIRNIYFGAREIKAKQRREDTPFYQHELVWLLNERGVMFLAQGLLDDAVTCLRKAIEMASGLFVESWINLNYGLACIEKGHLNRASQIFSNVVDKEKEGVVPELAKGWLGLIHHIQGDHRRAREHYTGAIHFFEAENRPRAVAIFTRHLADLYRVEGKYELAKRTISKAMTEAERGGQLDILHLVRISDARISIELESDVAGVLKKLHESRKFAEVTGFDPIFVDATLVLSMISRNSGNLDEARRLAIEASKICTRNDLKLRCLSSQLLIAEIEYDKGFRDDARRIAQTVRNQCLHHGYQKQFHKAEEILLSLS